MTSDGWPDWPCLAQHWRRRPVLLRGLLSADELVHFGRGRFDRWCKSEETTARVYLRTEQRSPGGATARLMPHARDGLALYDHYARRGEEITLLLNGVERADASLSTLQRRFAVPHDWRLGDSVSTLSAPGAGIGYHGGSEDGFIVQLQGCRQWTIWDGQALSLPYRQSLCGHPVQAPPDERSALPPLLRVTLDPGDALYVPALYPHEGVTLAESISLSLAWRGLSAYQVLLAIHEARTGHRATPQMGTATVGALCALIEDPPEGAEPLDFLSDYLARQFEPLPPLARPSRAEVREFVKQLLLLTPRPRG